MEPSRDENISSMKVNEKQGIKYVQETQVEGKGRLGKHRHRQCSYLRDGHLGWALFSLPPACLEVVKGPVPISSFASSASLEKTSHDPRLLTSP